MHRGRPLIYLATFLSLGHHLDHVLRGTHTGWPLTDTVTPFTYSLVVYPLIAVGLLLSRSGKVGAGYWVLLSGPGAIFLLAVHAGPTALEPPADIITAYPHPAPGWAAFAWLVALVLTLAASCAYELRQWRGDRRRARSVLQPDVGL